MSVGPSTSGFRFVLCKAKGTENHLVKTVARERSGPVRKIRADGLNVKRQPNTNRQASGGT